MQGAIDRAGREASTIKFQTNHQNSTLTDLFQRFIKTVLLGLEYGSFVGTGHLQCEKPWFSSLEYFLILRDQK